MVHDGGLSDDKPANGQPNTDPATRRARAMAERIVGLPVDEARDLVALEPELSLRELAPDQAVTLEFRAGRVNAVVVGGVVTGAHAG